MATIKDVAKSAGVAVSTVSYALNGSSKVSEETRNKVLKAAEELNYIPNSFAQNLKKSKKDLIALIVLGINGPVHDKLIMGIQDVAVMFGYNLIIFCEANSQSAASYSFLKENIVDGAIIMSSNITDKEVLELSSTGLPLVLLDRKLDSSDVCSVLIDNRKGASEAVRHLIELNHKKIGFINGPENSYDNADRFKGYLDTLCSYGLDAKDSYILKGAFTEQSGYDVMKKFLDESREIPTAFFSANDEMLIGAMRAIKEKGLQVPEDIALIGFDDIQAATYVHPTISTIKRPLYELGSFSAHTLFNLITGKMKSSGITLDVELVIRESSGDKR